MRTREVREIRALVLDGESVRLVAPPETGRTYLLGQLAQDLESRGYTAFQVTGRRPFRDQPYVALREAGLVRLRGAQSESDIVDELMQGLQSIGHPVILVDDADYLDLNSAYLLEQVRQRRNIPIVVVAPPFVMLDGHGRSALNKIRTQARLELAPLGYAQLSVLAQRVLGAPAQPEVLSQVLSMSSGMAGIAVAILRSAVRERRIVRHESGWALHASSLWNVHLRTTVEQMFGDLRRGELRALHALAIAESAATEDFQDVAAEELIALSQKGLLTTFGDAGDATSVAPRPSLIIDYFQDQPVTPLHYEAMGLLKSLPNPAPYERARARMAAHVSQALTFDRSENRGTGMDRFFRADTAYRLAAAARDWEQSRSPETAVAYLDLLLATDDYVRDSGEIIAQTPCADDGIYAIRLTLHRMFVIAQTDPATAAGPIHEIVLSETAPMVRAAAEAFEAYLLFSYTGMTPPVEAWWTQASAREDGFSVAIRHFIGVVSGRITEPLSMTAIQSTAILQVHMTEIANTILSERLDSPEHYERGLRQSLADARAAGDYRAVTVGAYFLSRLEAATFRDELATETVSVTLALGTPNLSFADFFCAQVRWAAYLHYVHGEPDLARSVLAETARYPGFYGPLPAMHPEFGEAIELLIAEERDRAVDLLMALSERCHAAELVPAAWSYALIAFIERPTPEVFAKMESLSDRSGYGTEALMGLIRSALGREPDLPRKGQLLRSETEAATAITLLNAIARSPLGVGPEAEPFLEEVNETIRGLRTLRSVTEVPTAAPPTVQVEAVLTKREHEIARLAETLQNREIADRLSISVRTVENHLARAMKKLGVNARTELTAVEVRPV
ncbi:helix-turn-helix transcriptional regulator [Leucobacter chromiireducens]|uniref:HTH luxR-type domain-containing protein n=1 Tax=Leucobacter chromiireducens subsp. solipictus TaxID=398235 RepID=A0ABS1SII6_9MICO|nr:LuxR C-terminal-related transcriptional regulator [Leucobacter chromiireducens]MBL3680385.1 hypothetical protein [Leucobacter chromiireducens subsp. solipictus]